MEGKINRDYLKSYSVSYTNNILEMAFKDSPNLQGKDLTNLCTPTQINYNLLKNIFLQWEAEVSKLHSPYFDYSATAVQTALRNFMDVLSRHIQLDKGSLRPLLQQAVEETMYQVFEPAYYFEYFLWPDQTDHLKIKELAKLKRFVKINHGLLQEIIDDVEEKDAENISASHYHQLLTSKLDSWTDRWEAVDPNVEEFSKIVSLQMPSLRKSEATSTTPSPSDSNGTKNVNDQFSKEVVSLNDKLQKEQTTLADQHLNKKVDNIKQSLTLNQKFMFVNELYAGNSEEFGKVMDKIEGCNTYVEAMKILDADSSERSNWDMESSAVKELMDLVSRRF